MKLDINFKNIDTYILILSLILTSIGIYLLVSNDLNDEFYFDYSIPERSAGYQWDKIIYIWLLFFIAINIVINVIIFITIRIFKKVSKLWSR